MNTWLKKSAAVAALATAPMLATVNAEAAPLPSTATIASGWAQGGHWWNDPIHALHSAERIAAPIVLTGVGVVMITGGVAACTTVVGCAVGGYAATAGAGAVVGGAYLGWKTVTDW